MRCWGGARRAGRAAFRIGLAKHDRELGVGRKSVDRLHASRDVRHLLVQPHLHMAANHMRLPFGMVRDEIERRVVGRAMLQELLEERGGLGVAWAGGRRAADCGGL
jgi:hypothetical protein